MPVILWTILGLVGVGLFTAVIIWQINQRMKRNQRKLMMLKLQQTLEMYIFRDVGKPVSLELSAQVSATYDSMRLIITDKDFGSLSIFVLATAEEVEQRDIKWRLRTKKAIYCYQTNRYFDIKNDEEPFPDDYPMQSALEYEDAMAGAKILEELKGNG